MADDKQPEVRDFAVEEAANNPGSANPPLLSISATRGPSSVSSPVGPPFAPLAGSDAATSSFVYPARSLLSKHIQPATEEQSKHGSTARPALGGRVASEDSRPSHAFPRGPPSDTSDTQSRYSRRGSFHQENYGQVPALIRSASTRTQPKTSLTDGPEPAGKGQTSEPSKASALPSHGDESIGTFASALSAAAVLTQVASEASPLRGCADSPRMTRTSSVASSTHDSEYFTTLEAPEEPPQETQAPPATEDGVDSGEERDQPGNPLNYSKAGIVHLGPARSVDSGSERHTESYGSMESRGRTGRSRYSSMPQATDESDNRSDSEQPQDSESANFSVISANVSEDEPLLVTHKFDFVTTDDGHHVITGREGKLTRCEDEPIRTPGAVQGYGVLMALEEDIDAGTLRVQQVSENCAELLGLSPKFLFSLECFTDVLPDHNVDGFWDNIQFLNSPSQESDDNNAEDSIHVFLLSGWGQPGSAGPDEQEVGPQARRVWHCWCAAHRPSSVTSSTGDGPSTTQDGTGLIILEFELERDMGNPLYPPPTVAESLFSGASSPRSGGGSVHTESTGATGSAGRNSSMGSAGPRSSSLSAGTDSIGTPTSTGTGTPSAMSGGTLVSGSGSAGGATAISDITGGSTAAESIASSLPPTNTPNTSVSNAVLRRDEPAGLAGSEDWEPTPELIYESTTSRARPLLALERLRSLNRSALDPPRRGTGRRRGAGRRGPAPGGVGMMDIFAVMSQINEQLGAAQTLEIFLKIVVGVIKDLTQFHRVLVYQFDESWNGQVVAELVDWHRTHDLYMGLHFPASDIPAQARELYAINKVRLLYDRDLPTARVVVRSAEHLDPPLNMTHCYLRAMSPIHIKYLGNMGVRASMSISIMAFGALWGLIACHSYGAHGMRVSFPVRQMLRLLSQSISRNIERLSYAQRLHTRKLINTVTSDAHPGGYIVSNADDLLGLFDADYGMLVIGEGAKILGPNHHGQEILIVAEYLRLKQFSQMQVSQAVTIDYPDLKLSTGLEIIAGLLYVPLSSGGKDFIAFLRKGQPREVHWAGKPFKEADQEQQATLEPRRSFKSWSQIVAGRSRTWTDEQLETAGVLALVYGKFIEVWRQKESALQSTKLTNLLLSNASHEVRTPLHHIINYLEMALDGHLDSETRDNLKKSHSASKSLLFTINDLLDLTRLESGNEISFNEPFDLRLAIEEAAQLYRHEASRRSLSFQLDLDQCPTIVAGDSKKIQTVVANLTGNALKYTEAGTITIEARAFDEPHGLRDSEGIAVEIVVTDTGCGISSAKLESIFREFEQVEALEEKKDSGEGVGLGLAVVAHIVEQLGGQLRVDSKVGEGSRFSFLIPFSLPMVETSHSPASSLLGRSSTNSAKSSARSARSEIDNFVHAISQNHFHSGSSPPRIASSERQSITAAPGEVSTPKDGYFDVPGSSTPIRGVKVDEVDLDIAASRGRTPRTPGMGPTPGPSNAPAPSLPLPKAVTALKAPKKTKFAIEPTQRLRVLIVEDDDINRMLLAKRLSVSGHAVENTTNGQECVDKIEGDREFDCVLMDVQMPILNGFQATVRVRQIEQEEASKAEGSPIARSQRLSQRINGRIPIFAVSASLREEQREQMKEYGLDGWILKPIDFKRLFIMLRGITDPEQREKDMYSMNRDWEVGGWLTRSVMTESAATTELDAARVSSSQTGPASGDKPSPPDTERESPQSVDTAVPASERS